MHTLRIDPHAHLYDVYPLMTWCRAALTNLQVSRDVTGIVVIADRQGQDSFNRFRRELGPENWLEDTPEGVPAATALTGMVIIDGTPLYVVRGVQYVSAEKLEVLGLGVARSFPDGVPCRELIRVIRTAGGIVCLPWSPGKWLGQRGAKVAALMDEFRPDTLAFGDISIHCRLSPPSLLLRRAARAGFTILQGTDPLARIGDVELVGSYGVQLQVARPPTVREVLDWTKDKIASSSSKLYVWGRPGSVCNSVQRFISTL